SAVRCLSLYSSMAYVVFVSAGKRLIIFFCSVYKLVKHMATGKGQGGGRQPEFFPWLPVASLFSCHLPLLMLLWATPLLLRFRRNPGERGISVRSPLACVATKHYPFLAHFTFLGAGYSLATSFKVCS